MNPYTDLPRLENIYLEDSWVLNVRAEPNIVSFEVDFVLTPQHPLYQPPRSGQQQCYVRGTLRFEGVDRLLWTEQGTPPARDASGELDYGHIDTFVFDEIAFELSGDWGRMELQATAVTIELESS